MINLSQIVTHLLMVVPSISHIPSCLRTDGPKTGLEFLDVLLKVPGPSFTVDLLDPQLRLEFLDAGVEGPDLDFVLF